MKRRFILIALLCALLLLSGCASSKSQSAVEYDVAPAANDSAEYAAEYGMNAAAATGASAAQEPTDAGVRKIVYTADMGLTADDPAAALSVVTEKAVSLGGYVAASYTRNDDYGAYRCTATLKVPAASLDALVHAAEEAGEVDSYQLSSDDISLSYYDIQARLSNAQAEEKQLLELLKSCETVEDMLAVREQLTSVRSDVESYQAQINLWDNLVDYATLELSVVRTEKTPVAGETTLIEIWKASDVMKKIGNGFVNSVRFTVNAIGAIGIFLAYALIPGAVLFACIGLPILAKRKKKKRLAAEAAASAQENQKQAPPQA